MAAAGGSDRVYDEERVLLESFWVAMGGPLSVSVEMGEIGGITSTFSTAKSVDQNELSN